MICAKSKYHKLGNICEYNIRVPSEKVSGDEIMINLDEIFKNKILPPNGFWKNSAPGQ